MIILVQVSPNSLRCSIGRWDRDKQEACQIDFQENPTFIGDRRTANIVSNSIWNFGSIIFVDKINLICLSGY